MQKAARDTEALSGWLDGELTDAEAAELEAELERDPELRAELEELEGVVRLLREGGPVEAPPDFHAKVMARVEQEHPVATWSFSSWFSSKWETFAIGLAAVAALLLVVPVGLELREAPPEAPPEQTSPAVAAPRATAPEGAASAPEEGSIEPARTEPTKGTAETPVAGLGDRGAPPRKTSGPPPEVLGKATTGEAEPVAAAAGGTAEEAGVGYREAEGPPLPDVAVSASLAEERHTRRTVVRSEDPALKRKVLAVATRYGSVAGPDGAEVQSSAMASSREQVVVTLDPTKLAAFEQELRGMGLEVESAPQADLLDAGPVQVRVTLQLVGGGGGEAEAAPPKAAVRAAELEDLEVSK